MVAFGTWRTNVQAHATEGELSRIPRPVPFVHCAFMGNSNVIPMQPHREARKEEVAARLPDLRRYPVDVRGNVTFTRLMAGLATVGLTVRIDPRSHRVVITDDEWEQG